MATPLFPESVRKYIRLQKARIRKEVLDFTKQQELIKELQQKLQGRYGKKKEEEKGGKTS